MPVNRKKVLANLEADCTARRAGVGLAAVESDAMIVDSDGSAAAAHYAADPDRSAPRAGSGSAAAAGKGAYLVDVDFSAAVADLDLSAPRAGSGSAAAAGSGDYPRRPDLPTFDGASSEAQRPLMKGYCSFCEQSFEHPSFVAYCREEDGFPFAVLQQPAIQKGIKNQVVNIYDPRVAKPACAWCLGKMHGAKYVEEVKKPDGSSAFKIRATWNRLKNKSRGTAIDKHHEALMFKLHEAKVKTPAYLPTASEIWEAHQSDKVKHANDWVTQVGGGNKPFLWLFYGCPNCKWWTIGSNHWWRVQRRTKELTDESTFAGKSTGSWRCCGCFGKWSWDIAGSTRLIVVGLANESNGFLPGYQFAFIGDARGDGAVDIKLNFLKTATLLTELEGMPVTEEALLAALAAIQLQVEKKFSKGMDEVSVAYSEKVDQCTLDQANVDIICQSPILSMPGPGRRILVIKQKDIEKQGRNVQTIDRELLHFLLDVVASTYAIEHTPVGPRAKATKEVKSAILKSEGFFCWPSCHPGQN